MAKHILVVDDDDLLRRSLAFNLEKAGYRPSTAANAEAALVLARRDPPDLVLLDIGLPGMDGLQALRELQSHLGIPVILLTARRRELDQVLGLELGADDYVTKPFSPRELVARVRAVLRRTGAEREQVQPPIVAGGANGVRIDLERRQVTVGGRAVDLTPTEFDLLSVLARHPGRVFTRLELLDRVQGYAFEGYERTVDAHVKNLRQKIEPDPKQPRYVLTVYGVGYRFSE
jgi:DNA-binding response OmpR family regulator